MASLWLERYRQGSFRGVPFKTDSHQFTGGRRKQNHEFPQRDLGRSEDLGRMLREFTLELLVIGDDYFSQRNALIEALEKEGPGELVHPYLGKLTVQVGSFSVSETVSEGRMARFSVEFTEAGEIKFPESIEDELSKTVAFAEQVDENSQTFFESVFSTANQAAHVLQDAADKATALAEFLESSVKKVTEPIAELTFAIKNFKGAVNTLVRTPGELAAQVSSMFNTLLDELSEDPDTARKVLGNFVLFGSDFEPIIGTTNSAKRIQSNQDAMTNFARQQAVRGEASSAVQTDFISSNAALESRQSISENIDSLLEANLLALGPDGETFETIGIDDELFQSLKDLQASVIKTLPPQGLSEVTEFTPAKTMPALVIAYRLFQDLDKEQELIDENNIVHPGFVPGNEAIEVIGVGSV